MSSRQLPRPPRARARRAATLLVAAALGLSGLPLGGCSRTSEEPDTEEATATEEAQESSTVEYAEGAVVLVDASELFSDRDLDASYDETTATQVKLTEAGVESAGTGVSAEGSQVTISEEGTYVVSGTLSDGRLVVDAGDEAKVQLVLDGASITSSGACALYVRSADKVFLTLADGSESTLAATGADESADEHNLDGAVWAADDLTANGSGSLVITSAQGHGVVAKDELTLVSGTLDIEAAGHAIQAKDSVAIADGSYTLAAQTDAIHCESDEDESLGFIYVGGGTIEATAASDGLDASGVLQVDGGSISVAAGDDGLHAERDLAVNGGSITVSESYEALEGSTVSITGGTLELTASDDGINAAGDPTGETVATGDETTTAQDDASDAAGNATGDAAAQGEAPADAPNGEMPSGGGMASPDGNMTAPDGNMGGGSDGFGGFDPGDIDFSNPGEAPSDNTGDADGGAHWADTGDDPMAVDDTASVLISGGSITISAGGDGIDSNGDLTITGGETYVSGPTSGADGSLDYAGTGAISGGILMAAGASGMAQNLGSESTQGSMLVGLSGEAGQVVSVADAEGTVLASFTPSCSFACVVVSAPGISEGGTYTVSCGDSSMEVTMDSVTYSDVAGSGGGMAGPGGMGW